MQVSKEFIIQEIKRISSENGGKTCGKTRFMSETGISEHNIFKYWDIWSDAIKDAGLQPNVLASNAESEKIAVLAHYIKDNLKFPLITTMRRIKDNGIQHRQTGI
jgi:hypothetical protein